MAHRWLVRVVTGYSLPLDLATSLTQKEAGRCRWSVVHHFPRGEGSLTTALAHLCSHLPHLTVKKQRPGDQGVCLSHTAADGKVGIRILPLLLTSDARAWRGEVCGTAWAGFLEEWVSLICTSQPLGPCLTPTQGEALGLGFRGSW